MQNFAKIQPRQRRRHVACQSVTITSVHKSRRRVTPHGTLARKTLETRLRYSTSHNLMSRFTRVCLAVLWVDILVEPQRQSETAGLRQTRVRTLHEQSTQNVENVYFTQLGPGVVTAQDASPEHNSQLHHISNAWTGLQAAFGWPAASGPSLVLEPRRPRQPQVTANRSGL
ncbi:hypothetical protein J6590_029450 [Homalodisca vitripennis]|nr:hypothetical protein J6590_029450 [Homalodisca vitripennis]